MFAGIAVFALLVLLLLAAKEPGEDPVPKPEPPNGNGEPPVPEPEPEPEPPGESGIEVQGFVLGATQVSKYSPVSFRYNLVNTGPEPVYIWHTVCAMMGADGFAQVEKALPAGSNVEITGKMYPIHAGTYYPTVGIAYYYGGKNHWIYKASQGITVT